MTQRNADKELIKPICENLRNLRIKEKRKQSRLADTVRRWEAAIDGFFAAASPWWRFADHRLMALKLHSGPDRHEALPPSPVINPQSPCFCRITIFYSSELALIRGFFRLAKRLANSQNSTQQLGGLGDDVGLAHEGCADEDGLGSAWPCAVALAVTLPASGDPNRTPEQSPSPPAAAPGDPTARTDA